jgi:hypothetical protein
MTPVSAARMRAAGALGMPMRWNATSRGRSTATIVPAPGSAAAVARPRSVARVPSLLST